MDELSQRAEASRRACNKDEARGALVEWAAMVRSRDSKVAAALAAGLSISEVAQITGLSRSTIYRALITGGLADVERLTL